MISLRVRIEKAGAATALPLFYGPRLSLLTPRGAQYTSFTADGLHCS